jgi:hypothetical protein
VVANLLVPTETRTAAAGPALRLFGQPGAGPLGRQLFEMDQDVTVMQPAITLEGQKPTARELGT